jgi:hypothetical protein
MANNCRSLVLLRHWIKDRGCAIVIAYKWLGILGIRPRREVNRATGKVESWLTDEQAATLTAYADALFAGHKSNDARDMATTRRSLVERVASAITDDDALSELWHDDARAAIREVAAWLIDRRRDDDWLAPFEELAELLQEEAK